MNLIIKILSFPIRLPLFLIFALLSAVISGFAMTVGVLLLLTVRLIASASTVVTALFSVCVIIELCCQIFQPEKYAFSDNSPIKIIILLVGLYAVCFILSLLPGITEKAFGLLLTVAATIWRFSKLILFCK